MALLEVEDVVAGYGVVRVLHGVTLEVQEGECVAVLGRNGAGKTTLLRSVSCLQRAVKGRITFAGEQLQRLRPDRVASLGIAHVQEGRRLFRRLSTEDNLKLGGYAVGRSRRDVGDSLGRIYRLFPVLERKRKHPGGWLSGGEQQMLAIGQALVSNPRMLLLDEPSAGLAPGIVAALLGGTLKRLLNDGITVLLAEQHVERALEISQRAYVLERGSIAFSAPSKDLLNDDRLIESYMGGESL